jgi:lupus La protein
MATAVEDSNPIANETKDSETTNITRNDDTTKDEAVTEKTNGEAHKDDDKNEATEDKPKDEDKFAAFRNHDSRDKYRDRNKHNDRRKFNDRGRHNDRGRGRGGKPFQNKRRTNYDNLEESNDADEIRRQVDFYFSDSNLPTDAYLLKLTGGHENNPVPLKEIHKFKRMQHFQPFSAVVEAVKGSESLNLSETNEITRKTPLDPKFTDDIRQNRTLMHSDSMPRSIYAKGFGEETENSQPEIEAFFAPFGEIRSVRLRRQADNLFKGSVFVEFADEQTAKDFLTLDPTPKFGNEEKELQVMSKQAYVDTKHQGILDGSVKPRSPPRDHRGGRGRGRGRGGFRRDSSRDRRGKDDRRSNRGGQKNGGGKGMRRDSGDQSDEGRLKHEQSEEYSDDERDGKRRRRSYGGERSDSGGVEKDRSASPNSKKRKRGSGDRDDDDVPTRAEAEAKRAKVEAEAIAGAEKEETKGGDEVKEAVEA